MSASPIAHELATITEDFSLEPFAESLQPLIDTALATHDKDQYRKGTLLVPRLLVWFVLILTLRRDKNYPQVLNWLVSGFRWLGEHFPEQAQLVSDGALSHARKRLGPEVFATLLRLQIAALPPRSQIFTGIVVPPLMARRARCRIAPEYRHLWQTGGAAGDGSFSSSPTAGLAGLVCPAHLRVGLGSLSR